MKFHEIVACIVLVITVITSCNKDEKCGKYASLIAPSEVNEGEDFTLEVIKFEEAGIENFYWTLANMEGYESGYEINTTIPYYNLYNFSIEEIGVYKVKMIPKKKNCAPIIKEKTISMKPKECDCPAVPDENVLYYSPSYEGLFNQEPLAFTVTNYTGTTKITAVGTNNNTLTIQFGILAPSYSSRYFIVQYIENWERLINIQFKFQGFNHPTNYHVVVENSEELFYQNTGNQIIIQFCNVKFKAGTTIMFAVSGKFVIDL